MTVHEYPLSDISTKDSLRSILVKNNGFFLCFIVDENGITRTQTSITNSCNVVLYFSGKGHSREHFLPTPIYKARQSFKLSLVGRNYCCLVIIDIILRLQDQRQSSCNRYHGDFQKDPMFGKALRLRIITGKCEQKIHKIVSQIVKSNKKQRSLYTLIPSFKK